MEWIEKMYNLMSEVIPTPLTQNDLIAKDVSFDEYLSDDPTKMSEGIELIFDSLKDYYIRLDEDEVREVLIDVVKNGKDLQKAREKYFPNNFFL